MCIVCPSLAPQGQKLDLSAFGSLLKGVDSDCRILVVSGPVWRMYDRSTFPSGQCLALCIPPLPKTHMLYTLLGNLRPSRRGPSGDAWKCVHSVVCILRICQHTCKYNTPPTPVQDCTASDEPPSHYLEYARQGIHIVTPNKKFGAGGRGQGQGRGRPGAGRAGQGREWEQGEGVGGRGVKAGCVDAWSRAGWGERGRGAGLGAGLGAGKLHTFISTHLPIKPPINLPTCLPTTCPPRATATAGPLARIQEMKQIPNSLFMYEVCGVCGHGYTSVNASVWPGSRLQTANPLRSLLLPCPSSCYLAGNSGCCAAGALDLTPPCSSLSRSGNSGCWAAGDLYPPFSD